MTTHHTMGCLGPWLLAWLGLVVVSANAQTYWPLTSRAVTENGPCDDSSIQIQASTGQCPNTCDTGTFACGDPAGTAIPKWKQCDGVNDCPASPDGTAITPGSSCSYDPLAGVLPMGSCATDELGGSSGCGGLLDTVINGGVSGLNSAGQVVGITGTTEVNRRDNLQLTTQLESTFRWSFYRAIAERRTDADCDLYYQKEMENEGNYVLSFSSVTETTDDAYYAKYGASPPSTSDASAKQAGNKVVYIEFRPSTGFVGTANFTVRIQSCTTQYQHTACALQPFDTGEIPVSITVTGHECAEVADYCGDHGVCKPVGGVEGKPRVAGCECDDEWKGHKCDRGLRREIHDDGHMFWVLFIGLFIVAGSVAAVWKFVLKLEWPWQAWLDALNEREADWLKKVASSASAHDGDADWEMLEDEETGALYWYNNETGEAEWLDPEDEEIDADGIVTKEVHAAGSAEKGALEPEAEEVPDVPSVPEAGATDVDEGTSEALVPGLPPVPAP